MNTLLIFSAFCFCFVLGDPVGPLNIQCHQGPEFWCQNLINAKDCNAVSHCLQTVWTNQILNQEHDSPRKICKSTIEVFQTLIKHPSTTNVFTTEGCGQLSNPELQLICLRITTIMESNHLGEFGETVNSEMICSLIEMYTNQLDNQEPSIDDGLKSAAACSMCSRIVGTGMIFLHDPQLFHRIASVANVICNIFPRSIQKSCKADIDKILMKGYEILSHTTAPQICSMIGMCRRNHIYYDDSLAPEILADYN